MTTPEEIDARVKGYLARSENILISIYGRGSQVLQSDLIRTAQMIQKEELAEREKVNVVRYVENGKEVDAVET